MHPYNDIAIPIAWPDQTARGDELWMAILKKIGIVKNLNFKVGHAAIVLIERKTGQLRYFDFGRYISPRGFGRARSSRFDPRLDLETIASFAGDNRILNLREILDELQEKEHATHGGGRMLFSICEGISFDHAVQFAEQLVNKGPIEYGALAPNNNSCSRYVAQILVNSLAKEDPRINKILFPENIKASPTSNVVNAHVDNEIYCYFKYKLEKKILNRLDSLKFQIDLLKPNFISAHSSDLPDDVYLGHLEEPLKPVHVPHDAQWLGGLGEGCWFAMAAYGEEYEITRFNYQGELDYSVICFTEDSFRMDQEYAFSFHVHHLKHVVKQNNEDIVFITLNNNSITLQKSI